MPYNEFTIQRIREFFLEKKAEFTETKMFGGICFMVHDKMCCAHKIDKKTGEERLMCRIGEENSERLLEQNYVTQMVMSGKSMKDYIYVSEEGFKSKNDMEHWLQLCLDFNPKAKASKK